MRLSELELQQYLYICFQLVSLFPVFIQCQSDSDAESYKVVEQKGMRKKKKAQEVMRGERTRERHKFLASVFY